MGILGALLVAVTVNAGPVEVKTAPVFNPAVCSKKRVDACGGSALGDGQGASYSPMYTHKMDRVLPRQERKRGGKLFVIGRQGPGHSWHTWHRHTWHRHGLCRHSGPGPGRPSRTPPRMGAF